MDRASAATVLHRVPIVELHVHLEGTIAPDLARVLAARNRRAAALPEFGWRVPNYRWEGFRRWHRMMRRVGDACLRTEADYADVAAAYAARLAEEGVVYAEINLCLRRPRRLGHDLRALVAGVAHALAAGPPFGLILSPDRNQPLTEILEDVAIAADFRSEGVVGIDLQGGPGSLVPARQALALARKHGLGVRAHAGEMDGPTSVEEALDLGVDRIAHGVRAIESPACLERLARTGTPLDVAPSSNLALGLFANWSAHPLKQLIDAGITVTLGSDDPCYFNTSARGEYDRAASELGLFAAALHQISRDAFRVSFAPAHVRRLLEDECFGLEEAVAVLG